LEEALTAFLALSRLRIILAAVKDELGDWRKVVLSWKRTWEAEWGFPTAGAAGGAAAVAAAASAAFFSASSFMTRALAFLISLVVCKGGGKWREKGKLTDSDSSEHCIITASPQD
jgi:hypothetical protein